MEDYKKSYKGFIVLMAAFVILLFLLSFITDVDADFITIIICNLTNIWMVLLTWIIYRTEKIYWYTGIAYEEAARTSSENRKRYAIRHFRRFAIYAVVFILYSAFAFLCNISLIVSSMIETIGIVAVAISTINIKLIE